MSAIYISVCFGLLNLFLWSFLFFRFKRLFSAEAILKNIKNEVDKLLIEISREADQDIGLIEARISGLKQLIEEADRRIKLAEEQFSRQTVEKRLLSELHTQANSAPEITAVQTPISAAKPVELQDVPSVKATKKDEIEITAKRTEPQIYTRPPHTLSTLNGVNGKPQIRDQILELYALGLRAEQIAERLRVSVSEVQLALAMYASR